MNPMNQTIDHSAEYYDVLGCGPHSDHDQIHAEYRHRALLFHPDKNGDNNGDWNRIREAYEVLGDPQRRAQYDRWRASRLPVPFAQWRRAPHAHAMHWSFDTQRAIEMPAAAGRCVPVSDIYAKFRNYEI